MNEDTLFHLGISRNISAKYAILTGDPKRVPLIAQYLDNPKFLSEKREFVTYIGQINGENVLITSTGIGGASASITVEELSLLGIKYIIRIGTCGGMNKSVKSNDLVIPTGSIRMEGTSKEYVYVEYPAVPDFEVLSAIVESAKSLEYKYHTGVVHCKDSFYGQHNPELMPNSNELKDKWQSWLKMGTLASEMETASIFIVSLLRGIKAGAVLLSIWNQELKDNSTSTNADNYNISNAINTAINAVKILINNHR